MVGFDLAHAAGNIKLNLHNWNIDFAAWCSYKYMNSSPGSIAGIFIHEKHFKEKNIPRFAGWWGYDKTTRFKMEKGFTPIQTAEGWQLSNVPILLMAAHKAALDIFNKAGMPALLEKSKKLTGYLDFIIKEINTTLETHEKLEIITPKERGCQLSIIAHSNGKGLFDSLTANGVFADWREPNVIRCAPVPLYNSFEDVFRFGEIVNSYFQKNS